MKILKRRDQQSLSGDSIFQMQRTYHGLQATSVSFVLSVAIQKISEISEISVKKPCSSVQSVALFMQNKANSAPSKSMYPFVYQKLKQNLHFCRKPKTNPIQTQTKPNLYHLGNLGNLVRNQRKFTKRCI